MGTLTLVLWYPLGLVLAFQGEYVACGVWAVATFNYLLTQNYRKNTQAYEERFTQVRKILKGRRREKGATKTQDQTSSCDANVEW